MMARMREDVCGGLFTSATNLQSFQSLIQLMQRARATGPTDPMQSISSVLQDATPTTATATRPPGGAQPPPPASAGSGAQEVKLPKITPRVVETPKMGRNDMVTVRRGVETQRGEI